MSNFTITVVGAGVIGTSIGLALKQAEDPPRLLAHDKDLGHARAAVKMGAFDKAEWNLINACEQADLIILAIPSTGVHATLEAIAPYLKEGVVISDTTPSKVSALASAQALLPAHAHFVSGNPIVRPAGSGYDHADVDLFQNRLYCLTPASSAAEAAVQLMVGIVTLLGAEPFFLDAVEHDGLITAIESLPAVASLALVQTLTTQGAWREMRKLAGPLFEQISAGAVGDPDAWKDRFLANRDNLVRWIDRYLAQLNELRALLVTVDNAEETLAQQLDQTVVARRNWLVDYQKGHFIDPELASPKVESRGLMQQLIGFGALKKRSSRSSKE